MRMSDWSSDVCSSDLLAGDTAAGAANCAGIERLRQGDLVVRQAPAGSSAQLDGRPLRVSADGWYAFGVARDARKPVTLELQTPGAARCRVTLAVQTRNWPVERVNGVPQATVSPQPKIARRIAREQARVAKTRALDSDLDEI